MEDKSVSQFVRPLCVTTYVINLTSGEPRYLLMRRCCQGHLHGTWQMVTGKTEGQETATEAAMREMREETGLTPTKLYSADAVETFFIHALNRVIFVPVFVAFVSDIVPQLAPDEHDTYEWLPFEEAQRRLVWSEQRRIIAHVHECFVLTPPSELLLIDLEKLV